MPTAAIAFSPYVTTVAAGSFNVATTGMIQGTILDHPTELFKIAGGLVSQTETIPMYGGLAITEQIPNLAAGNPVDELGGNIIRATGSTTVTGFTVFNQLHSAIQTPQSPVPSVPSGSSINFVRLGSGVRLAVAADPALAADEGLTIATNVSWDVNAQVLQLYDAATPTFSVTSLAWASTAGGRITVVGAVPITTVAGVGDIITFSGATNTGTGGAAAVNRTFYVDTFTDNQHFTVAAPAAAGVYGTIAGTILVQAGTGILPVKLLSLNIGNSMTVDYNPLTGFITWNRSGTTAVILI